MPHLLGTPYPADKPVYINHALLDEDDALGVGVGHALTTVIQDFGLLGRKSLEELLRLIDRPQERFRHFVFQPTLVVRETSGRVRATLPQPGSVPASVESDADTGRTF